ncbi:MAG: peptidoglycan editing factor PgeF [Xanthomonadales bacterium]|nr:Polyphenol oxidase [Xanthomonadales bacterium]MCC6594041.1 peptidoglycan editing factor PgeF [Xanthomonadales bacterium]MCE7932649.1 peptidoglycan editing factor PgeF [Xanthomonadales bacterium PRO6]
MKSPGWIAAEGLPHGVRGGCATRACAGVSDASHGPANYGERTGDDPFAVARNRELLCAALGLRAQPLWLEQVHGRAVHRYPQDEMSPRQAPPRADACIVRGPGRAAAVLTADCLPLLLAGRDEVAAVHAGWRGLAAGVVEATVAAMQSPSTTLHAWIGPAIGQDAFEVGPEVRAAFVDADPGAAGCFRGGRGDRWHADLVALARRRLAALGIARVHGGAWCTHADATRFHSFRRDGARSGRMATLVWREPG